MAKFAYNNAKNASTEHTFFKLNYGYHPYVSFEKDSNPHSKSQLAEELFSKLRDLMIICQKNFYNAQDLQKRAYDKSVRSWSYATGAKIWVNSKYIKTK